ncbi:hypothetical protein N0V85_007103 [Neurospora sp. IMI 360204]|nr:hypothetical protein N0V85_007103 [Neurospora sp. IMI 360204]
MYGAYFKPQVVYVSFMCLIVLAQALGSALSHLDFIPRKGAIGRFLNPFPWNRKEHTAAVLMASAASVSALSTEALSVQELWYGGYPSTAAGVSTTLSSQLIGYGVAGMMRSMLYPANLPITTVMETLHKPKAGTAKRFNVFWIIFVAIFCWEWFPKYIFPILSATAVSIFCLADQNVFTNLVGFLTPLPFYIMHRFFFPQQRIWSYLYTAIILWHLGELFVGLNASITSYYMLGAFGQFYLRRYRPQWFVKWNYLGWRHPGYDLHCHCGPSSVAVEMYDDQRDSQYDRKQ